MKQKKIIGFISFNYKFNLINLFTLLLSVFFTNIIYAQRVDVPRDADTSRLRPPTLPLPKTPKFDLRIESPEKSPVPKAVDDIEFDVNDIQIEGADYYPDTEVNKLFVGLIGNKISLSDLRASVENLENKYKNDGFFLVRVFIPPQEVADGIFKIKVIEGYIDAAYAEGGTSAAQKKINSIMANVVGKKPINLATLERVLLLLNDLPGISGSGVLRQGDKLGASELIVTLNNLPPKAYSLTVNNGASKTMGLISTNFNATLNNPFSSVASSLGIGLSASVKNNNLRAWNTSYSQSIGDRGAIFSFAGLIADAEPKGSLKALGIVSRSYSLAPRIRFPLKRGRQKSYYVELGVTNGKSKTTLQSSSITVDKSTVADLAFSLTNDVWFGGSTQISFSVFHGLDLFGSFDKSTNVPSVSNFKQKFTKLKLIGNHSLPFNRYNLTLKANVQAQWTDDKLLAGEQVSFGGPSIGRGYDGGAIAGDKGFGLSFELTKNIINNPLVFLKNTNLEFYTFVDYAEAYTLADRVSGVLSSNSYLGSHGLGFRINGTDGLSVDFMAAKARNTFPSADARGNPRYVLSLTESF